MTGIEMFGAELPIFAAPMAGGPTTPSLVVAAANAGGFGFLAGGYLTTEDLAAQITATRARTESFGVNLFVPGGMPVDDAAYRSYRARLAPIADHYGVELPERPVAGDDEWHTKVDLLVEVAPPVMSFTFAIPDVDTIRRLHQAGVVLAQTVTSSDEAMLADEAGMDALVLQAPAAGGHSGTLMPGSSVLDTPLPDLVRQVAARTALRLIAGGGIASANDVEAALTAGASAVSVGTALLLAPEAGTSPTHRRALTELRERSTTITHAFTGRPARGISNTFISEHLDAPLSYPAIHFLTQPIRRAAAAAGEAENVHLWAGINFAKALEQPAAETLRQLADY